MQGSDEIKFGTDGWRAVISDTYTFTNVRRVARAIAVYYRKHASSADITIAVGYDTRFLSERYAALVAEALAQDGIGVLLSDRAVPTPALSFAVRHRRCAAGVMITASHNPGEYNGIKIKTASGGAAPLEVTGEVERYAAEAATNPATEPGEVTQANFITDYVHFLRSYLDAKRMKRARFRILVDPMHGSGNGFIEQVLKGSAVKVTFMRRERNPWFGGLRPEPVVENLKETMERMKKERFDLCLVLDGDADRIAAIVPGGEFVSPQKILGLLALHLHCDRGMKGGVVKTIVGTNLMDNLTRDLGLRLYETPVGFKYISALMEKEDILVGGEEAGGMGFKNYIPERDGTLAGLLLLEMMAYRTMHLGAILKEAEKKYGRYYYLRSDMKIRNPGLDISAFKAVKEILGKPVSEVKDYDGVKLICANGDWLMFRGSGTEPIMRVYAESKALRTSKRLITLGEKMVMDRQKHVL